MKHRLLLSVALGVIPFVVAGCEKWPEGARPIAKIGDGIAIDETGAPYELGKQNFASGQLGLAAKYFQVALLKDPGSLETLNALGATYDRLGRYDAAERYYNQALALQPGSAQTLNNLGYSYLLQGRYDLAAVYLRNAREVAAGDARVEANYEMAEAALNSYSPTADPAVAQRTAPQAPRQTAAATPRIERMTAAVQSLVTAADQRTRDLGPSSVGAAAELTPPPPYGEAADAAARRSHLLSTRGVIDLATPAPVVIAPQNAVPVIIQQEHRAPDPRLLAMVPARSLTTTTPRRADDAEESRVDAAPEIARVAGLTQRLASSPVHLFTNSTRPTDEYDIVDAVPNAAPIAIERQAPVPPGPRHIQVTAADAMTDVPIAAGEIAAPAPRHIEVAAADPIADVPVTANEIAAPALRHIEVAAADAKTAMPAPASNIDARAPFLEVSNGAGRLRMAARMREFLADKGLETQRLTNADNFRHMTSTIFYREGWEAAAAELAKLFPAGINMIQVVDQRADVRLELGGDLLDFDHQLIKIAAKAGQQSAG